MKMCKEMSLHALEASEDGMYTLIEVNMDIPEALDGILNKKLEIKKAMLVFEKELKVLQNEISLLVPEVKRPHERTTDPDIESEPVALQQTLYLLKEISDSLSFIEAAKGTNPLLYPDIDLDDQKNHYKVINEAVYEIMKKKGTFKIKYSKKLQNLAELLLNLEEKGDIEHVSPKVVAECFLVGKREVNPRSYSSALCQIRVDKQKEQIKAREGNSPLIDIPKTK